MIQPWKMLSTALVFSAAPWVQVYRESVQLPNGRVLDDFYRVVLPDFAVVVALTTDGQLIAIRGYKHGIGQVVRGLPAGLVDAGESPLQTAQRELLEETGYAAPEWRRLGSFVVDGNRQCGTMHVFLARQAAWSTQRRADETEEVEVDLISPQVLVDAVRNGEITHLATATAIALAMMAGLDPCLPSRNRENTREGKHKKRRGRSSSLS